MQGLLIRQLLVAKDAISRLARDAYTSDSPPGPTSGGLGAGVTKCRLSPMTRRERLRENQSPGQKAPEHRWIPPAGAKRQPYLPAPARFAGARPRRARARRFAARKAEVGFRKVLDERTVVAPARI
jgi:hypothetical protein